MSSEYEFVRISADQYSQFAALAKNAFGVDTSPKEFESLFATEQFGMIDLGYMAYHSKTREPAAFYGVFPCPVEYNGETYLAAQSGSTMTHSQHRKRGLFFETAKRTYDLAKSKGINFVFGFPNPNSYPGLMKLGWTHRGNINNYHIFVPTLPIGYLGSRLKIFSGISDKLFHRVSERWKVAFTFLPNSVIETDIGGVVRNADSLRYKPGDESRVMLRFGNSSVQINRQGGSIGIGEMDLDGGDAEFRRVMRRIKFLCFLTGSIHLRSYMSPDCKLDKLFRNAGYRRRAGIANCYLDLGSGLPLENFKYVYADFDTF